MEITVFIMAVTTKEFKIKGTGLMLGYNNDVLIVVLYIKYRGPILRVTSQALGSDDSNLDQSAISIQILLEPSTVT